MTIITQENNDWRAELEREAEDLNKKNQKLDNAAVLTKFLGALLRATTVLVKFSEMVLGQDRNAVFNEEMAELDEISNLYSHYEKKCREHQTKLEELNNAKSELEILKNKMK